MSHAEIVELLKYLWYALAITWLVTSVVAKRTLHGEASLIAISRSVLFGVMFYLLYQSPPAWPWLHQRIVPRTAEMAWIGFAVAVVGAAFGIWARVTLGRN